MSSWITKDFKIYSRFRKYKSKLLRGTGLWDFVSTMDDASPRSMNASMLVTKGLSNRAGENNCFLNSAVQILWHLDVFRKNFHLISHHACLENSCIFCALKVIFTQFAFSEEMVLPPDVLRKALAMAFENQQKFQIGLMDDAAECFENILTRMHVHLSGGASEDHCTALHCISHQKFAMMLIEQVICKCGETSEPLPFVQLVHYVTARSIIDLAQTGKTKDFGHMLRLAQSDGNLRNQCPSKCGEEAHIERTLTNVPDVVSIGLIWDSAEQTTSHVRSFLEAIGTELCLVEMFDSVLDVERASVVREHKLVGMVCYYGKHYSAFLLHSKSNSWKSCDDAQVTEIGSKWTDVIDKCARGRYQPLLLLYQNPDAVTISESCIPTKTTILTSAVPKNDGRVAAATATAKRSVETMSRASTDHSLPHVENCNISNNIVALSGIRFDRGPTVTPSAPTISFSRPGTKPSAVTPSGGPSTSSEPQSRPSATSSGPGNSQSRPFATSSGPSSSQTRPLATSSGPSNSQTRPCELSKPGSSHSLPRSSDSTTKHPSSQLLADAKKTGSYSCIPTSHPQHLNLTLHQQHQPHLTAARIAEIASNSPGRGVIGNSPYQQCYNVFPGRPAYAVYNAVPPTPLNRLPYPPGTMPPIMSSHDPSFSNIYPGLAAVRNSGYGIQTQRPLALPPSAYGQGYYGGVAFPSPNLQATQVPGTSVGQDYSRAGNRSDALSLNEGRQTDDVARPHAPASDMNLMEWSIIDERMVPSPDSDSTSSQYDNCLDILSADERVSGNSVPLVVRNESLTDSYFVVPDAQYLDDMANGKDLTKEADQLIEQSEAKENSGDMHGALICCNQATNLYVMARKDPSNRVGNGDLGLKEKRASSRSKRLLQVIEYNQMKSKSDAKNRFSTASGSSLQTCTSPIEQDLLIFSEDPTRPSATPQCQALMANLPQLYSQNCGGGSQRHWVSK